MKYSTKLSDAVHILVLIAVNPLENLTSSKIAESVHTNPAFIRQLMSLLKKGGIIKSTAGHARPELAVPCDELTLYDVYKAVEGDKPLLHLDTHTNPECGAGVNIQLSLAEYYDMIQLACEEKMKSVTLVHIIETYYEKIHA